MSCVYCRVASSCVALCRLVLPCLVVPFLVVPCLVLPCLVLSCLVLHMSCATRDGFLLPRQYDVRHTPGHVYPHAHTQYRSSSPIRGLGLGLGLELGLGLWLGFRVSGLTMLRANRNPSITFNSKQKKDNAPLRHNNNKHDYIRSKTKNLSRQNKKHTHNGHNGT